MAQAALREDLYSNTAYEFYGNQTARRLPQRELLPEEKPQKQLQHRTARPEQVFITVLGCVVAAVVMLMVVFAHQKLYETTYKATALQNELSALQEEQVLLRSTYDSSVDITAVERVAVTELGMGRPVSGQTVYVNISGEDRAEVLQKEHDSVFVELADFVAGAFSKLAAYLHVK